MELNTKLIALRKKKGLSQSELAEKINVSRQTISRWEVGKALPTSENLKYLSQIYKVSFEYLLLEDEEETEETEEKIAIEANDLGQTKEVEHSKKRVYHRTYHIMAALVVMIIGIVIAFTIHKSVETKQKQENIVVIESMEQDEVSGKIKEEEFFQNEI